MAGAAPSDTLFLAARRWRALGTSIEISFEGKLRWQFVVVGAARLRPRCLVGAWWVLQLL
jgi:hypothetical protein